MSTLGVHLDQLIKSKIESLFDLDSILKKNRDIIALLEFTSLSISNTDKRVDEANEYWKTLVSIMHRCTNITEESEVIDIYYHLFNLSEDMELGLSYDMDKLVELVTKSFTERRKKMEDRLAIELMNKLHQNEDNSAILDELNKSESNAAKLFMSVYERYGLDLAVLVRVNMGHKAIMSHYLRDQEPSGLLKKLMDLNKTILSYINGTFSNDEVTNLSECGILDVEMNGIPLILRSKAFQEAQKP